MVDRSAEQVRQLNQHPIDRERFPRDAIVVQDRDATRTVYKIADLGAFSWPVRVIRMKRETVQHQDA